MGLPRRRNRVVASGSRKNSPRRAMTAGRADRRHPRCGKHFTTACGCDRVRWYYDAHTGEPKRRPGQVTDRALPAGGVCRRCTTACAAAPTRPSSPSRRTTPGSPSTTTTRSKANGSTWTSVWGHPRRTRRSMSVAPAASWITCWPGPRRRAGCPPRATENGSPPAPRIRTPRSRARSPSGWPPRAPSTRAPRTAVRSMSCWRTASTRRPPVNRASVESASLTGHRHPLGTADQLRVPPAGRPARVRTPAVRGDHRRRHRPRAPQPHEAARTLATRTTRPLAHQRPIEHSPLLWAALTCIVV